MLLYGILPRCYYYIDPFSALKNTHKKTKNVKFYTEPQTSRSRYKKNIATCFSVL